MIPAITLRTHDGGRLRLPRDLAGYPVAVINFFYTTCTGSCERTTANLVQVERAFGDRLGRDIVMLSVSVDPVHDSPAALAAYARRHAARRGWHFATGTRRDIDLLRARLGVRDPDDAAFTHTGLLVYGSPARGQWAVTPALLPPAHIAGSVLRLLALATS
jgi:protein SCO1/2